VADHAILVTLIRRTDESDHPGAFAFSEPYGGNRIRVFYDRVLRAASGRVEYPLAYVLAHEIAHMLEGSDAHADSGIMKAHWDTRDYGQMERNTLLFTAMDIELIRRGLESRRRGMGTSVK
jgi:hypothetical protein